MNLQFHHSILLIKSKINRSNTFSLDEIKIDEVEKEIRTLKSKKDGTQNNIPAKNSTQLLEFYQNFSTKL